MAEAGKELPHFVNQDGKKIVCRYWLPEGEPRALVFICHGAGEHSGCYQKVAKAFTDRGFKVFAHDHVGHGLSEGVRVHLNSFSEYTRDIIQHVEQISKEHKNMDRFIVGHSLGGCIALKLCMDNPDLFKGMLLIGPAVEPMPEFLASVKLVAAKLVSYLVPTLGIRSLNPAYICRDKAIVDQYEKDPLVHHGPLTIGFVVEILSTMEYIRSNTDKIKHPMYVIHGSEDMLTHVSGAVLLQDKAASTDKTVQIIDGAYHQIHNEPDGIGPQCIKDMCDWVAARC